jgi:hypothetical protein
VLPDRTTKGSVKVSETGKRWVLPKTLTGASFDVCRSVYHKLLVRRVVRIGPSVQETTGDCDVEPFDQLFTMPSDINTQAKPKDGTIRHHPNQKK